MQATLPEPRFDLVVCGAEYEIREARGMCNLFGHFLAIFFGVCLGWAVLPILLFFPRFWCVKFTDNQVCATYWSELLDRISLFVILFYFIILIKVVRILCSSYSQMITLGLATCIGFGLDYVLVSFGLGFLGPFFQVHKLQ
jgi:hypothetical protein